MSGWKGDKVQARDIGTRYRYSCRLRRRLIVSFWLREEVFEIPIRLDSSFVVVHTRRSERSSSFQREEFFTQVPPIDPVRKWAKVPHVQTNHNAPLTQSRLCSREVCISPFRSGVALKDDGSTRRVIDCCNRQSKSGTRLCCKCRLRASMVQAGRLTATDL